MYSKFTNFGAGASLVDGQLTHGMKQADIRILAADEGSRYDANSGSEETKSFVIDTT